MSLKTRQRALLYVIGKRVRGIVDVKETDNTWAGYPTYLIRYEDCRYPGEYNTAEFLPSAKTQQEINDAMAELDYQAQGKEFPVL